MFDTFTHVGHINQLQRGGEHISNDIGKSSNSVHFVRKRKIEVTLTTTKRKEKEDLKTKQNLLSRSQSGRRSLKAIKGCRR